MRAQRRALDDTRRHEAAVDLSRRLRRCRFFIAARRIAVYLPNDGEIALQPVIEHLWRAGHTVALPVVRPDGKLDFAVFDPDTPLGANKYGIPEPLAGRSARIPPRQLDLVLMPLVAFDATGNRLGMGGGYYDRTFSYLRHRTHWKRPFLAGIAFDFQKVPKIAARQWDVPLRRIVTDKTVYG